MANVITIALDLESALATAGIIEFGRQSVLAFAKAEDAARVLSASGREAGLAYDDLRKKAETFGKAVGASQADAERTFASIVAFTKQAGQTENLDKFSKALTDLAAARGIATEQLPDLVRQLATLQDEATDKLFGANPSAFYDAYAKSLGKTAAQLTDAEKRASLLDQVIKKGDIFSGEAERRLAGVGGQLSTFNANLENLQKNLGKAISGPANSLIGILNAGTSGESNKAFEQLTNYLGLTDTRSVAGPVLEQTQGIERAKKITAEFRKQEEEIRNALANPNSSAGNLGLAEVDLTRFTLELDPNKRQELLTKGKAEADKIIADFKGLLERTAKDSDSSVSVLRLAVKELNDRGGVLGEDQQKIRKQLEDAIEKQVKPALEKVKDLGKNAKNFLSEVNLQGNDNPFVRLFSEADRAADKFKETTKGLSKEIIAEFTKIQQQTNAAKLFETRLNTRLSAFDLRSEARDFRAARDVYKPLFNPSDSDLLNLARNDRGRYGEFLDKDGNFADEAAQKNFRNRFVGNAFASSQNIGDRSDSALLGLMRELSRGGGTASEDPARAVQERLRDQIKIINDEIARSGGGGANLATADRRLISLTQGLRPEDLTGNLGDLAAGAREREAVRLETQEKEAERRQAEQNDLLKSIDKRMEQLNKIAEADGIIALNAVIENRTGGDIEMQTTPQPERRDTQYNNLGNFGGRGGLSNR